MVMMVVVVVMVVHVHVEVDLLCSASPPSDRVRVPSPKSWVRRRCILVACIIVGVDIES
jgi:hypothetical protein